MREKMNWIVIFVIGAFLSVNSAATEDARTSAKPGVRDASLRHAKADTSSSLVGSHGWSRLSVEPRAVFLSGGSPIQRLIVSADRVDGSSDDLTSRSQFSSDDSKIATVEKDGLVRAVSRGATYVRAVFGGLEARAFVVVRDALPKRKDFNFAADIAPIISHFGCNGSNCHGTITGQNGFKLSLFGYDPDADYEAIVKASDGRRINRFDPEQSLLLLKPTFSVKHGGGFIIAKSSPEYRTLRDWIVEGALKGEAGAPRLLGLDVYPQEQRFLTEQGQKQRLVVVGRYSDGTEVDMTAKVRYTSSNPDVATVTEDGVVKAVRSGETGIMVRSLGAVGAARMAVVLRPSPTRPARLKGNNFIDDLLFARLARHRIVPSEPCTDAEFLRRVSLDITGTLPRPEEAREFLADRGTDKRERLVNDLLQRPEYADFWSMKWGDLLTNTPQFLYNGTAYFQAWIRSALASNMPYDRFTRELLTASGGTYEPLPSNFYSIMKKPEEMATFTSQVFLGISLECARCHDHPSEKWRRDDFLGLAAFFSQVKFKGGPRNNERFLYIDPDLEFKHPDTKLPINARYLGGTLATFQLGEDRRAKFAEWLTSPSNPYFGRTAVNRVWKEFMVKGIVDPVDDFRITNPPTHPELLDRLAEDFAHSGFDLHHLIRRIVTSQTYQLSARPNETNQDDTTAFSRYYIRRLSAEQLLDAISQVTEVPERFPYFYLGKRAIQLPDPIIDSYFLTIFDRPSRENATCTRKQSTSLTQMLHFVGGNTINAKIRNQRGALSRLIREAKSDEEILGQFYLAALSRIPTSEERRAASEAIRRSADRRSGLEDVLWVLLNSKEFLYNH